MARKVTAIRMVAGLAVLAAGSSCASGTSAPETQTPAPSVSSAISNPASPRCGRRAAHHGDRRGEPRVRGDARCVRCRSLPLLARGSATHRSTRGTRSRIRARPTTWRLTAAARRGSVRTARPTAEAAGHSRHPISAVSCPAAGIPWLAYMEACHRRATELVERAGMRRSTTLSCISTPTAAEDAPRMSVPYPGVQRDGGNARLEPAARLCVDHTEPRATTCTTAACCGR